jgi:hypothetical protein
LWPDGDAWLGMVADGWVTVKMVEMVEMIA